MTEHILFQPELWGRPHSRSCQLRKHSVSQLRDKLAVLAVIFMCVQCSTAGTEGSGAFPSVPVNTKTLKIQTQAEELFERRDYDRAYFIYRNELAPIGDKYGQYMVGFMHLAGKGVPEDPAVASAWYRLAAERELQQFVRDSEELFASLNPQQAAGSDRTFIELRKQYGDLALLMKAVRDDYDLLAERTGSRLSGDTGPLTIVEPNRFGAPRSAAQYYGQIRKRMEARLEFIVGHTQVEISNIEGESVDLASIEASVVKYLGELK